MTEETKVEVQPETKVKAALKPAEIEKIIVELGKKGEAPEKIGLILRDQHGVPQVKTALGKKVARLLKEHGISVPTTQQRVGVRVERIKKHITAHKHDYTAKRSLTKKLWLVREK